MELFSEEVKKEHLTNRFIIVKAKCLIGREYPKYVRNGHGIVINFRKVERYPEQDDRYEQELSEMWKIARKTLKALNTI